MGKINNKVVGVCQNKWDSIITVWDESYNVLNHFYNKKFIDYYKGKSKDEIPLLILNQYQEEDSLELRRKVYLKRWSGTVVVDIDPPGYVKEDNSCRPEALNCIQKMIEKFQDEFNYKTSASGIGLHLFQQVFLDDYSDEETFVVRDFIYENINKIVREKLDDLNLPIDYQVDEAMLDVNQVVMLNYSGIFQFKPINLDIVKHRATIATRIQQSKTKPNYTSTPISVQNQTQLTSILQELIPKMKDRVGTNSERWKIPFLIQQAGMDKSVWDNLYELDAKTSKGEWDNYWHYAESRKKTLPVYLVNQSLNILNRVADTNYQIREELEPDHTVKVDQYVTEASEEVSSYLKKNNKVLIEAATGSGKTSFIIEYIRGYLNNYPNEKIVIAVDTKVLANQLEQKSKYPALHGDTVKELIPEIKKQSIIICTYDSLKYINTIDLLIVDEAHQLVSAAAYREKALKGLWGVMKETKTIAISATPEYLFPLKSSFKHLKIEVKKQVSNHYHLLTSSNTKKSITKEDKVLKHLYDNHLNGKKCVIYLNNSVEQLMALKERIETQIDDYKVVVWHSELKVKEGMKELLSQDQIANEIDIVITTSIFQNGVNVLNGDVDRCYTDQIEKTSLIQFSARFRKGSINIFLLCNPKESDKSLKGFEGYKRLKYAVTSRCNKLNEIQVKLNRHTKIMRKRVTDITLDLDTNQNRYLVNDFGVSYSIMKHNESIYYQTPNDFLPIADEIQIDSTLDQCLKKEQLAMARNERQNNEIIILENLSYVYEIFEKDVYRYDSEVEKLTVRAKRFLKKHTELCKSDYAIKKSLEVKNAIAYFQLKKSKAIKLIREITDVESLMYEVFFHVWKGLCDKGKKRFVKDLDALEGLKFLFLNALSNAIEPNKLYKDEELKVLYTKCLECFELLKINPDNDRERMKWIKILYSELKTDSKSVEGISKSYQLKPIPKEFEKYIKTIITYYSEVLDDMESFFSDAA